MHDMPSGAASPAPRSPVPAGKAWRFLDANAGQVGRLVAALGVPEPIARALVNRSHADEETAARFLDPRLAGLRDPAAIPTMAVAVRRVWDAIRNSEPILVFGDYDVDGIASTALLTRVLRELGATVASFIPHRIDHGYGLTCGALRQAHGRHHPRLIITVDCGTGSVEAVELARELGVDVIVTDHHEPPAEPARALALLNPKAGGSPEDQILAGVGVAFKLAHALVKLGRSEGNRAALSLDLRRLLYLVALGTIADMVPLVGENRILASHGLDQMNRDMPVAIQALCEVSGIREVLTTYHIGFLLGPRINAAGRMDSPETALELLLCDQFEKAAPLAAELQDANEERKLIESEIESQALRQVEEQFDPASDFAIVASARGWHPGVVGIVASRLVGRFHRPAIVIGIDDEGKGKGSCRSIDGFDLVGHLGELSSMLVRHGGHPMAAGLEIQEQNIGEFRARMNDLARRSLNGRDLRPVLKLDAWLDPADIGEDLMGHIGRMMPFGLSNPTPVWACRGLQIERSAVVGRKHLKMQLRSNAQTLEAIAFGFAEREIPPGAVDVAFQLRRNHFNGQDTLQLQIEDIRPSA